MPIATSPLRYPGGKSPLLGLISRIIRLNKLQYGHYAEPYAGGCGLALGLLYSGHVSDIHINDIDQGIWAFWHVILNRSDEFIDLMHRTPITLEEWYRRRDMHRNQRGLNQLEIAFTTFFLNRTNRSGIIKNAGVIGGLGQRGQYTLDCRFTKSELERRIRRIRKYRDHIHLHRKDALDFLEHVEKNLPERTFLCIDPPYFNKGSTLYTSFYAPEDHAAVAKKVLSIDHPWIITYDYCAEISALYTSRRQFEITLNYSAQVKRVGSELMIPSKGLKVPKTLRDTQVHRPQYRGAA